MKPKLFNFYAKEDAFAKRLADEVIISECVQEALWQLIAGEISLEDFAIEVDRIKDARLETLENPEAECMDLSREARDREAI